MNYDIVNYKTLLEELNKNPNKDNLQTSIKHLKKLIEQEENKEAPKSIRG